MGFLSLSEQDAILNCILNGGSLSNVTPLYVGLCTGLTASTGAITGEPSGNNYSRVTIASGSSSPVFGATSNGSITNNNSAITFPIASGSWGTLTNWFISTSSSGGVYIIGGALSSSVTVSANQAPTFAVNQLTLNASGW